MMYFFVLEISSINLTL